MTTDPGPRDPGAPPVRVWGAATFVAMVLAVVSALATPLMGLPDEPAHVVHATAVVHGQVAGEDEVRTTPENGWTRTETVVEVPAAYAELPLLPTCYIFMPEVPADCAPTPAPTAGPMEESSSTVGTYDPVWYAAVGWPARVLPPTAALYGMRIVGAVLFAALVGVAAAGAWRAGGRRWTAVGVAAALPPVAVHMAGGVNPSGTEIAAAVALWTTTAALLVGARDRGDVARWVVAAVVLAVTRPLGPVLVVGLPVAAWLVLGRRDGRRGLRGVVPVGALVLVGAVVAAAMGWTLWRGTLDAFSGIPAPELTTLDVLRQSVGLVPERLDQMVGVLGWADTVLPRWLVVGWYVVIAGLLVVAARVARRAAVGWLALVGLGVLVVPVLADLRSAAEIGLVWQGRYTLPLAAGLPICAGLLLDRVPGPPRSPSWAAPAGLAALGVGHVVALATVLRRFRVGADGDLLVALGDRGAALPISGLLLLGIALSAVVVGLATSQKGQGRRVGEPAVRR